MAPRWDSLYPYYMSLAMHPDGDFSSCAVRLSMALHHADAFSKPGYRRAGNKVSAHGWAMGAEQLYRWLRLHQLGAAQELPVDGTDPLQYPSQNGIVHLRDCLVRTSDRSAEARTGDHIDLYVAGQGLLSAIRWPTEFPGGPFGIVGTCRDGKVRFWPAS